MRTSTGARRQWLEAGQHLLRGGGFTAVKIQALTEHLGLTTGSFYHHFPSMGDYLDELAEYFGRDQPAALLSGISDRDPRTRLRRLHQLSLDEQMFPLYAAMRAWAASNERAAQAVAELDHVLLRFIEAAFRELGYPAAGAKVRAQLLLAGGVARISTPWPISANAFEVTLDVLAPRDTKARGRR